MTKPKPTEAQECKAFVRNKLMPIVALIREITQDERDEKKIRHYIQMSRRNIDKILDM